MHQPLPLFLSIATSKEYFDQTISDHDLYILIIDITPTPVISRRRSSPITLISFLEGVDSAFMWHPDLDGISSLHDSDPYRGDSGNPIPSYRATAADLEESSTNLHDEDADDPPADYGFRACLLFFASCFGLEGFVLGE